MNRKKVTQLTWTFLIAGILFIACIVTVYMFKDEFFSSSGEFSAQVRNIALSSFAISSIPFLLLGHINRQRDIEIKRSDALFKTESEIVDKVYQQLDQSSHQLKLMFDSSAVKINSESEPINIYVFMEIMMYTNDNAYDISFELDSLSALRNLENWEKCQLTVASICSSLKSTKTISNEGLKDLLLQKFTSILSADDLLLLYFVAAVSEIDEYKRDILSETYDHTTDKDMTPESLIDRLDLIDNKMELERSTI